MLSDAHWCDFPEGLFPTSASPKYQVVPVCKGQSEGVNKQGIMTNEFCGSASDTLAYGMYQSGMGISSCSGRLLPIVREEFIRHAVRHMQVGPPGTIVFRANSSPLPAPSPQQQPLAEFVGCVGQCDSITRRGEGIGSLKRGRAAPQRHMFQHGSLQVNTGGPSALDALPSLEHSTDPQLPDGDEEIMRGMFELFEELAKAGGTLKVRVLFPCVCAVIQDATSFP